MATSYISDAGDQIKDAYNRGGLATAAGQTIRSGLGAVPAIISGAADVGRMKLSNDLEPIFKAVEGIAGVEPGGLMSQPPAAAPRVSRPAGMPARPPVPLVGPTAPATDVTTTPGAQPAAGGVISAGAPRPNVTVRYIENQPTVQGPTPVDPTMTAMNQINDGSWSGMINGKQALKRIDADRAAQVASTQAATGVANAETARIGATAGMVNANANAAESAAKTSLTNEGVISARYAQEQKLQQQKLSAELLDPKTTPERRKQIEATLVALHGKNPTQPAVHASPIFDAMGQKTGEALYERQADGNWKNVTPNSRPAIDQNPQAAQIRDDPNMSREDKLKKLQALGYT